MATPPLTPKRSNRLEELDGLRAFCVVGVILTHEAGSGRVPMPAMLVSCLQGLGPLGVHIFFCISGFIITSLQLEEVRAKGRVCLRTFYLRRFLRIVPAYWTFLLVLGVLGVVGAIHLGSTAYIRSIFILLNLGYIPISERWFCAHSWSLSVEEQYYIFLPFLLWVVLRGRRRTMLVALGILYFVTAYSVKTEWMHLPFDLGRFSDFKYIIIGVILAIVWPRAEFLFHRIPLLVPLVLVVLLSTRFAYTDLSHLMLARIVLPTEALAVAYVLGWCVRNRAECGVLRWAVPQWLGRCSYSIYLWQQLFTGKPEFYGSIKPGLPFNMIALLGCAALSYYLIEKPCIRLGHRISRRSDPETRASEATASLSPLARVDVT